MSTEPRLRLIQGGLSDHPGYVDSLPPRVYLEYPATLTIEVDTLTGQVISQKLDAMPDRVGVFDKDTWHRLHPASPDVAELLSNFKPSDTTTGDASINWLWPDPEDPQAS